MPNAWTDPWQETVGVSIAGMGRIALQELVDRTLAVAERLAA